jgi:DNA-binding NtrC family response regulator
VSAILIAEDEEILRNELSDALTDVGYKVIKAADGAAALDELKVQDFQIVLTDLRMPKMDGLELLRKGRESAPETFFLVMTAFGSLDTAIEALRAGATDYLIKPVAIEDLISKVNRLVETAELRASNRMLKRDLDRKLGSLEMIGQSAALEKIRQMIRKVAPTRSSVLIGGESGTGKELIARAIHALGAAKGEPFVPVNCAAIPEQLLESELFGHQKGAFTGAVADAEGMFRSARKGTLFLDEIGELPLTLQAKLLRVLEDKMIHPVGSAKFIPFEARVIAATNKNLKHEIEIKTFREDLYYRLAVVELYSPALRDRQEDIPLLINYLLRRFNRELNRQYTGLEEAAMDALKRSPWKGNIRELQNAIERGMIVGSEPLLKIADVSPSADVTSLAAATTVLKDAVSRFEQAHVRRVLNACAGDKKKAAKDLGISLSSLYRYLDEDEKDAPATSEVN